MISVTYVFNLESLSVAFQIFLYSGLGPISPPKFDNPIGYVCKLPHFGQGIGVRKVVAHHSIAVETKRVPHSLHLNLVVPKTISVIYLIILGKFIEYNIMLLPRFELIRSYLLMA